MPAGDGSVRGTFDLNVSPAMRGLRELRREGGRTDAQMRQLGGTLDRVGGKEVERRIGGVTKQTRDLGSQSRKAHQDVRSSWSGMRRDVNLESRRIKRDVDDAKRSVREFGNTRGRATIEVGGAERAKEQVHGVERKLVTFGRIHSTATVDVDGVAASIAEVELLKRRLRELDRMRATPRAAIGGGFGSGGGGSGRPTGRRGGGRGGGGFMGKIAMIGAAALPFIPPLTGGAVGLVGSAGGAALGAGTIGLGGFGVAAAGLAGTYAIAKPATKALQDAWKAQSKYNAVVAEYGSKSKQAQTAKRNLDAAFARNPGTQTATRELSMFTTEWKRLTAPGRRSYYGLLGDVGRAGRYAAPQLARDANVSTRAVRTSGGRFARFLANDATQQTLTTLTRTFARELPTAEKSLENIFMTFEHLTVSALPFFHEGNRSFERWTAGWRSSSRDIGKNRVAMKGFTSELKQWEGLTHSTFTLFKDLFGMSRPSGDSLVVSLTDTLDTWDTWLKRNPAKARGFFRQAADDTRKIATGVASVATGLWHLGRNLRPLLDPATKLLGLLGKISSISPGALGASVFAFSALRRSAGAGGVRALFGRGGGTGGGGVGGPMIVPLGGAAGELSLGARLSLRARATYAASRELGAGRFAAGLGAARYGAAGGALRVGGAAARFALPGLVLGGASGLTAAGANQGHGTVGRAASGVVNFFQGAASTFGLAHPVLGTSDRQNVGTTRAQTFLSQLPGGLSPTARDTRQALSQLRPELGRAEQMAADASFSGKKNDVAEAMAYLTALRGQAQAYRDIAKEARIAARQEADARSRQRAVNLTDRFGKAFDYLSKKQGPEKALDQTTRDVFDKMKSMRPAGAKILGDNVLSWAREMAKKNPALQGSVDWLTKHIEKSFSSMGETVKVVNGRIIQGTESQWKQISKNMTDPMEQAKERLSASFTAIQQEAVAALRLMGYGPNEANSIVAGRDPSAPRSARVASHVNKQLGPGHYSTAQRTGVETARGNARGGAVNGMIGGRGLSDNVRMPDGSMAAPGEAYIANRHTMSDLSRATMEKFGKTAWQMIRGEHRRHSATPTQQPQGGIMPGLARGGRMYARGGGGRADVVPHAPGGGGRPKLSALISEANRLSNLNSTYKYGGGHVTPAPGTPPWDCSSSWSRILQYSGVNIPTETSGMFANQFAPGRGLVTLYANQGHVYGSIGGHYWGTSTSRPHGGPGWFSGGPRPGFAVRHIPAFEGQVGALGSIGGAGGAVGPGGMAASIAALKAPLSGLMGVPGALANRGSNTYAKALTAKINGILGATGGAGATGGQGTSGQNQALGKKMMLARWGAGEWPALKALWQRESGWNANAVNSSSGASGIPQALGHGNVFALGDAAAQIRWGLNYIGNRYGTPSAAWAHEQSAGWYARGGKTPAWGGWNAKGGDYTTRGPVIFGAGEKGRERISIRPMRSLAGGAGGGHSISVTITGPVSLRSDADIEAVAEKVAETILDKLDGGSAADRDLAGVS